MENDLIGRKLGSYEITEFIGSGGMAEVYRGYHPQLDRDVAIKIVGRGLEDDPVFNTRFRREAKAIARLRHPNIIQVYDFGTAEGGHYMVMQYADGPTLAELIDDMRAGKHVFEPDDISFIIRQIAAALDHAHSQGVIHRDVKPANIVITRAGQAILTDFGLALLHGRAEDQSTGSAFGTPEYMAPEQITDSRAAGPASDIYSLGVILYLMTTGELPFEADSPVDMALRHLNETAPDPRHLNPDIPGTVAEVILKALAKSPRDRFHNALQFAKALEWAYAHPDLSFAEPELESPPLPGEVSPVAVTVPSAAQRTAVERVKVRRGPSRREERREKRRLRVEHRQAKKREKRERRQVARQTTKQRRRAFLVKWGRTVAVLIIVFLLMVAGVYVLQTMGILSISLTLPFIGRSPTQEVAVATVTSEPAIEEPTPTATSTHVPTLTPAFEPTSVPTATPLQPASVTPVPPILITPLEVGSSAYRVHDGQVMQFVPAGRFLMGTDDLNAKPADKPQHPVWLSHYWLDRTEITNAQFRLCVEGGPCQPPTNPIRYNNPQYANFPVTFVAYEQAADYCLWLASKSAGQVIGLPTEAQWEKAAAWDPVEGVAYDYPWGNTRPTPDLLRFNESITSYPAAAVGSYPDGASSYGVLDMAGNVWEWVADWYDPDYYKHTGIADDPQGPSSAGTYRITRGGSWKSDGLLVITWKRNPMLPNTPSEEFGFRCAMTAERPPDTSGVAVTPLDATQMLIDLLEKAKQDTANDGPTLDEWLAAFEEVLTALQASNNQAALLLVDERIRRVGMQRDTGLISTGLALQIEHGLLWMQEMFELSGE